MISPVSYCYDEDFGDPVCVCGKVAFACTCDRDAAQDDDEEWCVDE